MAPPGLFNLLDPTLHFLLGSFVSIVFIDADADAKTLSVKLPSVCAWSTRPHARVLLTRFGPHPRHSPTHACTHTHTQTAELAAHFIDPGVFVGLAVLAVFLFAVRNETKPLSTSQSLRANWHLWNAVLIYTMMDGLNGAFSEYGFLHTLHTKGYQLVDRRYSRHLIGKPSGPSAYEAAVAQTLNGTELIVYSWMSLLAAVGSCQQDAKWHKSIELIVLTMVRGSWCAVFYTFAGYKFTHSHCLLAPTGGLRRAGVRPARLSHRVSQHAAVRRAHLHAASHAVLFLFRLLRGDHQLDLVRGAGWDAHQSSVQRRQGGC